MMAVAKLTKMVGNECLLDTSIIVDSFRSAVISYSLDSFSKVYISTNVIGELFYGAYQSNKFEQRRLEVNQFVSRCAILFPDAKTAEIYAQIKTALKIKGKPIPENDIWIASIAIQHTLPLFTTDKHFKEVDGVLLVDNPS